MLYTLKPNLNAISMALPELDLVDQCDWENHVEFLSLEDAGLEEISSQPIHGGKCDADTTSGGVLEYIAWFYDGEVEVD